MNSKSLLLQRGFEQILNRIAEPVFVKNRQHCWVMLNDAFCKFLGRPREVLLDKSDYEFFPSEQADLFWKKDNEVFQTGIENLSEENLTDANGCVHVIVTKKTLLTLDSGEKFIVGILVDITEKKAWSESIQKLNQDLELKVQERTAELTAINNKLARDIQERIRIESALRLSKKRLTASLEMMEHQFTTEEEVIEYALEHSISLTESKLGYLAFLDDEEKTLTMYAWSGPCVKNCRMKDPPRIYPVESTGLWGEAIRQRKPVITNDYSAPNPCKKGLPQGHVNIIRHMNVPIFHDNKIVALAGVGNKERDYDESDVKQLSILIYAMWRQLLRRRAEEALADEKELLTVTLGSIGDGVISTDTEGKIVMMNEVARKLTGWDMEEARGKVLTDVFNIVNEFTHVSCENPVKRVLETGYIVGLANHTLLIARDGKEFLIADSGAPIRDSQGKIIGVVLVFRDVTEKQKIEEKLSNAQKLESLGVLAGGIAHDFNNLLTGIFGFINLSRISVNNDTKAARYLDETLNVLGRAQGLTQQLLTFAKGGTPLKSIIPVEPLLRKNASFVLSGSNIRCEFNIQADLWNCRADENQIGQAIDNVILNARQAMVSGGLIVAGAENVSILQPGSLPLNPGDYVKITIKDQGPGIAPELHSKIFDPFFTTKPQGSGLGLATAYSILKKHEGYIDVESQVGQGASFHLYLPAFRDSIKPVARESKMIHQAKGHILIMDDEDYIRVTASELLKLIGYRITVAKDGKEVVALYRESMDNDNPINFLILDLTVPGGMGGLEVINILKQINPNILAIASSGYSDDPIMADPSSFGFRASLRKPYTIMELSKVLENL